MVRGPLWGTLEFAPSGDLDELSMIYRESISSVFDFINDGEGLLGGGTSWHNARWNVGIRGLMNFFVDIGQAYGFDIYGPAVHMSIGNLYSSIRLGP